MKTKALKKLLTTLMALINTQLKEIEAIEIAEITAKNSLTFEGARAELAKIADGEYYSLTYKLVCYNHEGKGDEFVPECSVYITGQEIYSATSWEEALRQIGNVSAFKEEQVPA